MKSVEVCHEAAERVVEHLLIQQSASRQRDIAMWAWYGAREAIVVIRDALLRGEEVRLKELGTLKVVARKERGYKWDELVGDQPNPNSYSEVEREGTLRLETRVTTVPAHRTVVFKPAGPLRRMSLEATEERR